MSALTGAIRGERNEINGPDSSKLKARYPTILMQLGVKFYMHDHHFKLYRSVGSIILHSHETHE